MVLKHEAECENKTTANTDRIREKNLLSGLKELVTFPGTTGRRNLAKPGLTYAWDIVEFLVLMCQNEMTKLSGWGWALCLLVLLRGWHHGRDLTMVFCSASSSLFLPSWAVPCSIGSPMTAGRRSRRGCTGWGSVPSSSSPQCSTSFPGKRVT